ncbi:MAG: COG4280 domain-containing protein [Candidatus Limnocylindrales bacterium]
MSSVALATLLATFAASAVEFVEAFTIVLAVGVTRGWRSTLAGVAAAVVALAVLVALFGTAIALFVPIDLVRLIVGGFLIIYGLQWLTKAVLRAGGAKAKHDELGIYDHELELLRAEPPIPARGVDWIGFTVAFKGVLLEGLEVAFIVVTFGASAGLLGPAALGAALAGLLVLAAALLLHRPLARVPENGLKFVVGLLLTSFGTFWAGEGIGIVWPLEDAAILVLLAGYLVVALLGVAWVRRELAHRLASGGRLPAPGA